jgi:hypothetical protein
MKEQFVIYEIALILKEKGFDQPCFGYYYDEGKFSFWNWTVCKDYPYLTKNSSLILSKNSIAAPLWQQVFTWLRDVHDIDINIETGGLPKMYAVFVKDWIYENEKDRALFTYEDAQEQAILKALELI